MMDEDWARSWEEKLQPSGPEIINEEANLRRGNGSIFRVSECIRETDPRAYEPKIVSIGPYHRDLKPMDQVKLLYLKRFIRRNPRASLKDYLQLINGLMPQSRSFYTGEGIVMNDKEFLDMLLLDGCFLIELLLAKYTSTTRGEDQARSGNDPILGNILTLSLVEYDMLLLVENQLPFFVLDSLFNLVAVSDEENPSSLVGLIDLLYFDCRLQANHRIPMSSFYHLLHLFHSCITDGDGRNQLQRLEPELKMSKFTGTGQVKLIPCATDLLHAQVKLRRKKEGSSYSMSFRHAVLEISPGPQLDSSSSSLYRNLIAFEQHFLGEVKSQVTSYAMFMGCLINSDKDLTLLRQHWLLEYTLDSQEAALFFRKLCRDAVVDHDTIYSSHLKDISDEVWEYYGKKWTQWAALLRRIYFPDPRDFMNLFYGVILVLALTALQTFYTVYAYYRPPK